MMADGRWQKKKKQLLKILLVVPAGILVACLGRAAFSNKSTDLTDRLPNLGNPLAANGQTGRAEPTANFDQLAYQIPFDFYGGHIYLPVSVNGSRQRWFILDSGAADIFLSQEQARALGLQPQGRLEIAGIGPRRLPAAIARSVTFNLAGVQWLDPQVVIAPPAFFSRLERYFGRDFSGLLGSELFERFVVEIDYQSRTLQLYEPKTYRYSGPGQVLPLKVANNKPYIKVNVTLTPAMTTEGTLLIDLGSGSALDLWGKSIDDYPQLAANTLDRLTLGVGGEQPIRVGRVESLQLGGLTVEQPITTFPQNPSQGRAALTGRIGQKILQRFKVILDYPHQRLILEPAASLTEPHEYDMSGLWLGAEGQNYEVFKVDRVFADTPASKAGLRLGDLITHVDGKPVTELTIAQVRQLLMSGDGQVRWLRIKRGNETLKVRLQLSRLI